MNGIKNTVKKNGFDFVDGLLRGQSPSKANQVGQKMRKKLDKTTHLVKQKTAELKQGLSNTLNLSKSSIKSIKGSVRKAVS